MLVADFGVMRVESPVRKMLRDAMRQAARDLENLKMVRVDESTELVRLKDELNSPTCEDDPESELLTAD